MFTLSAPAKRNKAWAKDYGFLYGLSAVSALIRKVVLILVLGISPSMAKAEKVEENSGAFTMVADLLLAGP